MMLNFMKKLFRRPAHSKRATRTSSVRLSLEVLEGRLLLATRVWLGGPGNDWNVAANWQGNAVPTPGDGVVFDGTAGNSSCYINADTTIADLDIRDPYWGNIYVATGKTLTVTARASQASGYVNGGTITFDCEFNWNGGYQRDGTTKLNGTTNITGASVKRLDNQFMQTAPGGGVTVNWSGAGDISMTNGSKLDSWGTFNASPNGGALVGDSPCVFHNYGSMISTPADGTTQIKTYFYSSGNGSLDIQSGDFTLSKGSSIGGTVTVSALSRLILYSGIYHSLN